MGREVAKSGFDGLGASRLWLFVGVKTIIEFKNVSYTYSPVRGTYITALKKISLAFKEGELIGIAGRNGSGKSTLVRHLNALLCPSEGQVLVDGMDTRERSLWPEIRRRVGMVFPNPDNQLVAPIVEEEVAFGPENLGLPPKEIRRRVDEVLAWVGLREYRQWGSHLLSGGQKQRLAIAGVLAMRPRYLVLDEPTSMLDPRGRREILQVLKRLRQEAGITVILVSHDAEELLETERLIVLEEGQVAFDGRPQEVFLAGSKWRDFCLDAPPLLFLLEALREQGLGIPPDVSSVESLVTYLDAGGREACL